MYAHTVTSDWNRVFHPTEHDSNTSVLVCRPGIFGADRLLSAPRTSVLRRAAADFWHFLTQYKSWWITPIVIILGLLALVAAFGDETGIVPFIYR